MNIFINASGICNSQALFSACDFVFVLFYPSKGLVFKVIDG